MKARMKQDESLLELYTTKKKHAKSIVLFGYKNNLPKNEDPVDSSNGNDKIFYNTIKKICNTNVRKAFFKKMLLELEKFSIELYSSIHIRIHPERTDNTNQ